jgi:hypothetical protein
MADGLVDPLAFLASDAVSLLLPVFYCRCVVAADTEPLHQRAAHAAALAAVAAALFARLHGWEALALVLTLQAVSTTAGWWFSSRRSLRSAASTAGACLLGAVVVVPLLPIEDVRAVGHVVSLYAGEELARAAASRLALVTIEIQLAIGYLGVAYLRAAQRRKNALIQCGVQAAAGGETGAGGEGGRADEGAGEAGGTAGDEAAGPGVRQGDGSAAAAAAASDLPSHRRRSKSPSRMGEASAAAPEGHATAAGPPEQAPKAQSPPPGRRSTASDFARTVRSFLLLWALPYFLQRCVFETINEAAAGALRIKNRSLGTTKAEMAKTIQGEREQDGHSCSAACLRRPPPLPHSPTPLPSFTGLAPPSAHPPGSFADMVEARLRVHAPFTHPAALAVFTTSNLTVDAHATALCAGAGGPGGRGAGVWGWRVVG